MSVSTGLFLEGSSIGYRTAIINSRSPVVTMYSLHVAGFPAVRDAADFGGSRSSCAAGGERCGRSIGDTSGGAPGGH